MGDVIPNSRWKKAPASKAQQRSPRSFLLALIVLPAAAFSAVLLAPLSGDSPQADAATSSPAIVDLERASFTLCSGPVRQTCVVDGDTIWHRGEKIRLVGFDAPEISKPACANEARLGAEATQALLDWLNAGAFSFEPNPDGRSTDRYGRALRTVSRGGKNVGETLLRAGLAEKRGGRRNVWC